MGIADGDTTPVKRNSLSCHHECSVTSGIRATHTFPPCALAFSTSRPDLGAFLLVFGLSVSG
jgi:hypothetical protein